MCRAVLCCAVWLCSHSCVGVLSCAVLAVLCGCPVLGGGVESTLPCVPAAADCPSDLPTDFPSPVAGTNAG